MSILRLIASDGFLCINKHIAKAFGLEAAVLLGELASAYSYWESQDGLTEDGMFFETVERVEENTTLTKYQQIKAVGVLEEAGIIRTERRGLPAKRYFFINEEKLLEAVDNKKSKNSTTGSEKTRHQEGQFFDTINNRENKNRVNKNINDIESCPAEPNTTKPTTKAKKKSSHLITDGIATEMMESMNISEPLREKVLEWLQYKREIGNTYKETGFKSLLKQVEKAEQAHGASAVMNQIDLAMSRSWQGMYLDKIVSNGNTTQKKDPLLSAAESLGIDTSDWGF